MMTTTPLLAATDLAAPLAWRDGAPIDRATFVAEATWLAERLPNARRTVNLCRDRYHFALATAAALLRGQTSLMPPNTLPATLAQLASDGGTAPYVLADGDGGDDRSDGSEGSGSGGLPVVRVARPAAPLAPARSVPQVDADFDAVCLLTSGSTGAPQPHGKRWGQLAVNIAAEAARLAELAGAASIAGATAVATVPAQHSYGFESSVLLALLGGFAFEASRPFYPADIAAALARVPRPRLLVTTPLHLKALLRAGVELPALDLVLSATAPLAPQLAAAAERATGAPLVEIYGCTEAGQVAARRTTAGDTWTTLGELRLHADGERCVVSGGHVLEPTPLADVLELHDARRFRLLGRGNDVINVAGKRSSLAHLNFHLNRIDGVDDGAFWLPDGGGGEAVRTVVFVVAPTLPARAIVAALRRTIEPAFLPRRVVHVDALPRADTGKLTAAALAALAARLL